MHIVEELIDERVPHLRKHKRLWRLLRPGLYKLLGYNQAVAMADAIRALNGRSAFAHVSARLDTRPTHSGLEHIPKSGPLIIMANHPTGLADGVFVFDALKTIRPDHIFMANADALRVIPEARDIIIPVEWVFAKRTPAKSRQTLKDLRRALAGGRAVIIFPSGVLAKLTRHGLQDPEWNPTAVSIAHKTGTPIIPLHIKARNSGIYYLLSVLNRELRDITLFHELLNKKHSKPALIFGPPINPDTLPNGAKKATNQIRKIVESL